MRLHARGTRRPRRRRRLPAPAGGPPVRLPAREIERVLGVRGPRRRKCGAILAPSAARCSRRATVFVVVPPPALDVAIAADLVEEVARITGYHRIPSAPMSGEFAPPRPNPLMDAEDRTRDALVACGLTEVITYSLTDPAWCLRLGLEADVSGFVCLANPMTADRTHLRRHILPGLLETLRYNLRLRRPRRDLRVGARLPPLASGSSPRSRGGSALLLQRRLVPAVVGKPGAAAVRLLSRQGGARDARGAARRRAAVLRALRGFAVPARPRRRRARAAARRSAPSANSTPRCATSSTCRSGGWCSASSTPRRCWPARDSGTTAPSRATRR